MTNTKEEEIWKPYPEFPFIEASNLGRVRTKDRTAIRSNGRKYFVKGRILKQQRDKKGYMRVQFSVNGKKIVLSVHRVVATCFIHNPNNYPEVNHIDNDPANNSVSNLEWCTRRYNCDYKKNFGTTPAEVFGRPVFAANLKTGKILYFESQREAARQLGVNQSNIRAVINGEKYTAGNCWLTEDKSEITEEKIREIKGKMKLCPVIAINPETSEVFWFESQSEAARQLGVYNSNVNNVVKGKQNKTGGYWFCYADSTAVKRTRAKFGDEMAEKVEKLMIKREWKE